MTTTQQQISTMEMVYRTALLKSPGVLQINVTKHILHNNQEVTLATDKLEELQGYISFSNDVNIESQSAYLSSAMLSNPLPEDEEEYIVESIVKKQFDARLGQY